MDLRLLSLAPGQAAKAADETSRPPDVAPAAALPEPPRMPPRFSRDDIGQVAEEVARVLRQRERLERNRQGGY